MKKLFPIAIILFMVNADFFGQECKYLVNKEDKFTNTITKETEAVELSDPIKPEGLAKLKNLSMILRLEGGKKYFTLYFSLGGMSGGVPTFIGNGSSKLVLLLDDKSKIELNMSGPMSDSKSKGPYKAGYLTHFELTETDVAKLSVHNITDVRALSYLNPFDFTVKQGITTSFYFSCIK